VLQRTQGKRIKGQSSLAKGNIKKENLIDD